MIFLYSSSSFYLSNNSDSYSWDAYVHTCTLLCCFLEQETSPSVLSTGLLQRCIQARFTQNCL